MVESTVVINLNSGLHARPAATFVQMASKYSSDIYLVANKKKVNAKSILGLMSLAAAKGSEVTVQAEGSDEQIAVKQLSEFLQVEEN